MAVCELISVGTEILLGDILNTDAQFLSIELAKLGISVMHQSTVGDNRERLLAQLGEAAKRSDIIILSGGLGPTPDDLTKEVCCEFFGMDTELHEPSVERIKSYFSAKGVEMVSSNLKQAMFPKDCVIFPNDCGTAPGMAIEKDGVHILVFPGPPRELKPMFKNYALPYLMRFSDRIIVSHNVRTFDIGESAMAELVKDLLEKENPTVAPYAKDGEALLRVTAMAKTAEEAETLCEPVIKEIKARLCEFVYGIDFTCIEEAVVKKLKEKHLTVAVAESCTGGLVAKRITDISGASEVFECGIVSYSNNIKHKILNVSQADLDTYGAVSETVARQMAQGVQRLSGADIGVSVTGIAGPESDSTGKPVGLIYIALADSKSSWVKELRTSHKERGYNRYVSASNALNMIRLYIDEKL